VKPVIGCLGAGRMGRGIAVVFAFAGHQVTVVDFKEREASAFDPLAAEARAGNPFDARYPLAHWSAATRACAHDCRTDHDRASAGGEYGAAALRCHLRGNAGNTQLEAGALAEASRLAGEGPIIASTTSTILVDDLAGSIERPAVSSMRIGSIRPIWCR